MLEFVKLAEQMSIYDPAGFESNYDDGFVSPSVNMPAKGIQFAALAGLGGLSTYGAITGKRNAVRAVEDALQSNVRVDELAKQISDNARARELLNGAGSVSTEAKMLSSRLRPQALVRGTKAMASDGLLSIIRAAKRSKLL